METTLKKLKKHNPCKSSWDRLLESLDKTEPDNEPLKLRYILDLLGVQDAIWAFRAIDGYRKEQILFIADCAEHVLHIYEEKYPKNTAPRAAILATRNYANGKISKEKLRSAADAAYAAYADAYDAADAAYAAYDAAYDAAYAAYAAADADADAAYAAAYAAAAAAADDAAAAAAAAADAAYDAAAAAAADAAAARQKELDWQKAKLIEYLKIIKEPTKEI